MYTRACQIPAMVDLDVRFSVMDDFSEYQQILSLASPTVEAICQPSFSGELARVGNDSMAELVVKHPQRFPGFVASLPMNNLDQAHREIERAVMQLGAMGIQLYTHVEGAPLDTQQNLEIIEHIAALRKPIWLHPIRPMSFADYATETHSKLDVWWAFGWPYETSTAMLRLVCAGVFDRWPDLAIITHHAGGLTPVMEGRIEFGIDTRVLRNPQDAPMLRTTQSLVDGLRKFYADTASFGSRIPLDAARTFFGTGKMLFASDMPFDPEGGPGFIRKGLHLIGQMELEDAQRQAILCGNIQRLLLQ